MHVAWTLAWMSARACIDYIILWDMEFFIVGKILNLRIVYACQSFPVRLDRRIRIRRHQLRLYGGQQQASRVKKNKWFWTSFSIPFGLGLVLLFIKATQRRQTPQSSGELETWQVRVNHPGRVRVEIPSSFQVIIGSIVIMWLIRYVAQFWLKLAEWI